jgi:hypothetical protein
LKGYRKRAKSGYHLDKKSSNSSERLFSKEEISEEMQEYETGDDFKYKAGKSKKLSRRDRKLKSLRKVVSSIEKHIVFLKSAVFKAIDKVYLNRRLSSNKSKLEKAKKKLKEFSEDFK